ncbi:MAG: hypothetical protein U1F11_07690 [Steroidobacteraceae bacterium]
MARFDHLADDLAAHDRAELDRRDIGCRFVHAAAHVGIERQVVRAHQHLALADGRQGTLDQAEVFLARPALRPAREQHLHILRRRHIWCTAML